MKVKRYKLIYSKNIDKEDLDELNELNYMNSRKIKKELLSDYIRILGHDFMKNNSNKTIIIINNKKYKQKQFINGLKKDEIKINIILCLDISNVSHIFENCIKLKDISFKTNIIDINDEGNQLEEIYPKYEDNNYNDNDNSNNTCGTNLKNDYLNYSKITKTTDNYGYSDFSTMNCIQSGIKINEYNHYYEMN